MEDKPLREFDKEELDLMYRLLCDAVVAKSGPTSVGYIIIRHPKCEMALMRAEDIKTLGKSYW